MTYLLLLLQLLFFAGLNLQYTTAAPIRVPDLRLCNLAVATSPTNATQKQVLDCCLPIPATHDEITEFFFERYPLTTTKIRRPAHRANRKYIQKLKRAYAAMRALPDDDPRSFAVQANIHCAFCSGAYKQRTSGEGGKPALPLQVHFSWLFLPWHRWFLFFHERILGSLIGDPGFALPFWNWDNQIDGNSMPHFFIDDHTSPLYDRNRNQANVPPALVRLRLGPPSPASDAYSIVQENLNIMYQSVFTASTADMFMGGAYREGMDFSNVTPTNAPLGGALEMNAHGGIHYWTGDPDAELRGDMGVFTTASRDPLFYAHHSNVDRLWEIWKSLPGERRTNPKDPDFLETEFLFYDENAKLVKVKVQDALDNEKLGIKYKKVSKGDKLWIRYNPSPLSQGSQVAYAWAHGAQEVHKANGDIATQPKVQLGSKFVGLVKRPPQESDDQLKEVLLIQGLEVTREDFIHLQMFVNLPQANASTPTSSAEYLGSSNIVPTRRESLKHLFTNVMLEIGDNLRRIGLEDEDWVVITILAQSDSPKKSSATIYGMEIEYR